MNTNLQRLYKVRFSDDERDNKRKVWYEICKFIEHEVLPPLQNGHIVDIAAGYCDFINQIHAGSNSKKYAFDLNPDVKKYCDNDVSVVCAGINEICNSFEDESVTLFFMSNFLEHLSKVEINQLLIDEFKLLKPGGYILILTPNIKYVGGKYWDFFDHITPITDACIIEAAETVGLTTTKVIKKFLPFTTKSRLPQWQWIVNLYLKLMPFSGYLFGEQSLLLFRK